MGTHLDVAAEQSSFIRHDGLDDNSRLTSKTVHALLITKCEGKALSLVSLAPRRHGFEAWRVLKEEYEGIGGHLTEVLFRGILNPRARWQKMHREGRDLGDMLASWEKDVAQYRIAAGTDLQQAVQVAIVMAHAPAADRDLLQAVPLANRETYQALRAYMREWTLAQRTYGGHGRHTTPDTSALMDIGQVKGTKGKGKKGKKGKGKEKGKGKRDNGEVKEKRSLFCWRVWVCGKWGHKKNPVQEAEGKPLAAEAQAAVRAPSGRNARILFESGADEHVCPTDLASAAPLGVVQGQHALRCTRTRDRSSWHENCVHEARTRRSERGSRNQRHKCEITDPCDAHGLMPLQELGVRTEVPKIQWPRRTRKGRCCRRFRLVCSVHRTGIFSISNDGGQRAGSKLDSASAVAEQGCADRNRLWTLTCLAVKTDFLQTPLRLITHKFLCWGLAETNLLAS